MKINALILDQKNGDYRDLVLWPGMDGLVFVMNYLFLAISPVQPPPGVSFRAWVGKFTELVAKSYGILSAQRLLPFATQQAMADCAEGEYPSLKKIASVVAKMPVGPGQRLATYRESLASALMDMDQAFGPVFNYSRSDCLQRLFATPGVWVIEVGDLGAEHLNTLAHYLTQYLYSWKAANPATIQDSLHLLVYEDFSSLVTKARSQNAGGATLLEDRGAKQRYLNIGGIYLVHGVSELAPLLLQNANLIMGTAPKREDDRVLKRVYGLSSAQVDVFKRLPRGTMLASTPIWPNTLPVYVPSPQSIKEGV